MAERRKRPPIVGVMGSGQPGRHDGLALELGRLIAEAGYTLLTGGGGGIMLAASRGAAEAGGLVVGILPSDSAGDPRYGGQYPNEYVHIPVYTGLAEARNAINVKSSSVVVALPGGPGTLSEIAMALKARKHVILLNWPELTLPSGCPPELLHHAADAASALEAAKELIGSP